MNDDTQPSVNPTTATPAALPEPDVQSLLGQPAIEHSPLAPPVPPPSPTTPTPEPLGPPVQSADPALGESAATTPLQATQVPGMDTPPPRRSEPLAVTAPSPAPVRASAPVRPEPPLNIPSAPSSESDPPIVSRVLAGASQVSAMPFTPSADPESRPAPPPAAKGPENLAAGTELGTEFAPPAQPGGVPTESSTLTATPSSGAAGGPPPVAKSGQVAAQPGKPGGLLSRLRSRSMILGLVGALVVLVIAIIGFTAWRSMSGTSDPGVTPTPGAGRTVNLTYWGLWEPESIMQPLIAEYEQMNPGVKIEYTQQKSDQYRLRLQSAIRDGSGPDIFRYHNTWMPMVRGDLATAPRSVMTAEDMQSQFFPVMANELVVNREVAGIPLMYDGLALLYNQDMLAAANEPPPTDWEAVRLLANRLAIRTGDRLERGGIAMGTTGNVDHFSDIVAVLMLQGAADPANPTTENAQQALEFYTIFSRVDKVWDDTMPNSINAFATEKVAMIIAPSWRIHDIQKQNPNLRIGVSELPQLGGEKVTWASYWVEGVSKGSRNSQEAWKFLRWLSEPEQLRRLYSEARTYRGFGELYPRADMASELQSEPLVAPYVRDALYARSWYLASWTHDEGLNDGLIQYYADAVNQLNQRGNAKAALDTIVPGIQQVLTRFNVPSQAAGAPVTSVTQ